jgi:hypothetical protein
VHVVSPDEFIDRTGVKERALPRLRFHQVSWAPEIRPVLRADGHYPPLDAGPVNGLDFALEGFRRWPFIFWEWGRWHIDIFNSLIAAFGHPLVVPMNARDWNERAYKSQRLSVDERLALYSRAMKQADNWGWQPDEDRQKRPYLYGLAIIDLLLEDLRDNPGADAFVPLNARSLDGLEWLLVPFIDVRIDYLRRGVDTLGARAGEHVGWAHKHLSDAETRRRNATIALERVRTANEGSNMSDLLVSLRDHCRHVFLATDHLQRAWASIADTDAMVIEMYKYLYDLYPPLLYAKLRELAPPEELALVEDPPLI